MSEINEPNPVGKPPPALAEAIRLILRPLIRLLLHYQITLPVLVQWLKRIYIEVAEESFPLSEKKQTDSRISLLTGVHRKDVKRIRHEPEERQPTVTPINAQLVEAWLSNSDYCDDDGNPAPLPKFKSLGGEVSFEHLVQIVSKGDLRARVILDEWLHLNMASIDEFDQVCLNLESFMPAQGFNEKAFSFGRNIHDHLLAAGDNLSSDPPIFFDRHVFYNHLTPESLEKLKAYSDEFGMEYLKAINRKAKRLQTDDRNKRSATNRLSLGLFFFHEDCDQKSLLIKKRRNQSDVPEE